MMVYTKTFVRPSFFRLEQGTATYGPNMFADVTEEEFKANYLSKIPGVKLTKDMPLAAAILTNPPKEIEWNTKGNLAYLASSHFSEICHSINPSTIYERVHGAMPYKVYGAGYSAASITETLIHSWAW